MFASRRENAKFFFSFLRRPKARKLNINRDLINSSFVEQIGQRRFSVNINLCHILPVSEELDFGRKFTRGIVLRRRSRRPLVEKKMGKILSLFDAGRRGRTMVAVISRPITQPASSRDETHRGSPSTIRTGGNWSTRPRYS